MKWQNWPERGDPRLFFALILSAYLLAGITLLGFNRSPQQIALIVASACLLDMLLHALCRGGLLLPLSALISALSLSILTNFAHTLWLPLVPVALAISSKYLISYRGRHVYNPSLFGIVMALLLGDGFISAAPAYQWAGTLPVSLFIVTLALVGFLGKIRRGVLVFSFLAAYALSLAAQAWLLRHHLPPQTLLLGTLSSPAFYLFCFFMLTDPQTSPDSRAGQFWLATAIVVVDFILRLQQVFYALFYAAFIVSTARFLWLHGHARWQTGGGLPGTLAGALPLAKRWATALSIGAGIYLVHAPAWVTPPPPSFQLQARTSGFSARPGEVLQQVDARLAHVGKWLLSVGDAGAVADVDNDGLLDIFLTLPLKHQDDRAALYRNLGDFRFRRVPLPALAELTADPRRHGLPSGALWLDYDNDGDSDLLLLVGFGPLRLLQNQLQQTGTLSFRDRSDRLGQSRYAVALTANAFDLDRDGCLDLAIGNAIDPWLSGYAPAQPQPLSIFALPEPAYSGDRRMLNIMHRSWHDASNGGENTLLQGDCQGFHRLDNERVGFTGKRWTLDIGSGDFNGDGWTDLYLANDFGPDQLLLNQPGASRLRPVSGYFVGELGRDTYKGMNASLADFDNNGWLDVYVSNVHHKLQAEGSLLWLNQGDWPRRQAAAMRDAAAARNALNEHRFGWGAAAGDLDNDGRIDLIQANGMVDDAYDKRYPLCRDYWYWNGRLALTDPDVHGYADRWADLRGRCIFPNEPDRVYLNTGPRFVDAAAALGWHGDGNSRGVVLADFDNDGALDVLITRQFRPPKLYRNSGNAHHWLGLSLQGNGRSTRCNRDAFGSRVRVSAGGHRQLREVRASNGFSAQGDKRLLFGLGSYQGLVEVSIDWCGQRPSQRLSLASDRYHVIRQPQP